MALELGRGRGQVQAPSHPGDASLAARQARGWGPQCQWAPTGRPGPSSYLTRGQCPDSSPLHVTGSYCSITVPFINQ